MENRTHIWLYLTEVTNNPEEPVRMLTSKNLHWDAVWSADAQPTEAETAVWNQVSAVLEEAHGILAELQSYSGAGQEIREVRAYPNSNQFWATQLESMVNVGTWG